MKKKTHITDSEGGTLHRVVYIERKVDRKHQPISEGISREPRIISYHTGPQKIAKEISFHMTINHMMVAEQIISKVPNFDQPLLHFARCPDIPKDI